jgi:excisionase family DNA binding protein
MMKMTDPDLEPMVTSVSGVSRALLVSEQTVRKMIKSGELKCVRIGDRQLVRIEDLRAFLEARANDAA